MEVKKVKQVVDGNEAVAQVSYAFTEVAAIYPITPSSTMAEKVEEMSRIEGRVNAFGNCVDVIEMQSEAGVAGTMHGLLKTGVLATSYTSSQGLLLMEPTLFKMVGEGLPAVIHVAARSLSTAVLSIFGDHSDVMTVRQLGAIMMCSSGVQEAAILAAVAHDVALKTRLPVIHFFDGFNTSHEQRKIELPSIEQLAGVVDTDKLHEFRMQSMRNDQPTATGSNMTPDIYFQQMEASNILYRNVYQIMEESLQVYNPLFNTSTQPVEYYGDIKPRFLMVSMGSVKTSIHQVIDELNQAGKKVASLSLHLYRPFPQESVLEKIPNSVEGIIVLDRTKENGSISEPLLADIQSLCYDLPHRPTIIGGRYGLGSKEVTPDLIRAAFYEVMKVSPKKRFTLGITDDVTHLSLVPTGKLDLTNSTKCLQAKIWGFGSDGAVSCSRQTVKIIGKVTSLDVQGQFWFDSRKSYNLTISHLRFSDESIRSSYKVYHPNVVVCYTERYLQKYDVLDGIQEGGIFLLNTLVNKDNVDTILPNSVKKILAQKRISLYIVPANRLAKKYNLGPKINTIMQTCFLSLLPSIDFSDAFIALKNEVWRKYIKVDKELAQDNLKAMEEALKFVIAIPVLQEWATLPEEECLEDSKDFKSFQRKVLQQQGDTIPVSAFVQHQLQRGTLPTGTSQYEKNFICDRIPDWSSEKCLQCNLCATLCPHAAIRPFLLKETKKGMTSLHSKLKNGLLYRLQVSPEDCTGCGICVDICPAKDKALKMISVQKDSEEVDNWRYVQKNQLQSDKLSLKKMTIGDSQYQQPLLEFSSACASCGETAYIKLLTQLFGTSMLIANATGCSSIWGCSNLTVPYSKNLNGFGPVWGTSLLENNAEYGYGMQKGTEVLQEQIARQLGKLLTNTQYSLELKKSIEAWIDAYSRNQHYEAVSQVLIHALINEKDKHSELVPFYDLRFLLSKRSQWIIGGDGWAYDIGYGGLDHILSKNSDINVLILDNQGYANTGGQTSKATPAGSKTKFSSDGNRFHRKDLASIFIQQGNIFVAQIAIGAHPEQTLRAILDAERYKGPSVIIAYSPCILHGMIENSSVIEEKLAVECGFWPLFRYYPETNIESASFHLDCKQPKWQKYQDFLKGEYRFSSVNATTEDVGNQLLQSSQIEAQRRFEQYQFLKEKFSKK